MENRRRETGTHSGEEVEADRKRPKRAEGWNSQRERETEIETERKGYLSRS